MYGRKEDLMPRDVFPLRKRSLPCLTVNIIIGGQVLVKEDSFTLKKIISDIS